MESNSNLVASSMKFPKVNTNSGKHPLVSTSMAPKSPIELTESHDVGKGILLNPSSPCRTPTSVSMGSGMTTMPSSFPASCVSHPPEIAENCETNASFSGRSIKLYRYFTSLPSETKFLHPFHPWMHQRSPFPISIQHVMEAPLEKVNEIESHSLLEHSEGGNWLVISSNPLPLVSTPPVAGNSAPSRQFSSWLAQWKSSEGPSPPVSLMSAIPPPLPFSLSSKRRKRHHQTSTTLKDLPSACHPNTLPRNILALFHRLRQQSSQMLVKDHLEIEDEMDITHLTISLKEFRRSMEYCYNCYGSEKANKKEGKIKEDGHKEKENSEVNPSAVKFLEDPGYQLLESVLFHNYHPSSSIPLTSVENDGTFQVISNSPVVFSSTHPSLSQSGKEIPQEIPSPLSHDSSVRLSDDWNEKGREHENNDETKGKEEGSTLLIPLQRILLFFDELWNRSGAILTCQAAFDIMKTRPSQFIHQKTIEEICDWICSTNITHSSIDEKPYQLPSVVQSHNKRTPPVSNGNPTKNDSSSAETLIWKRAENMITPMMVQVLLQILGDISDEEIKTVLSKKKKSSRRKRNKNQLLEKYMVSCPPLEGGIPVRQFLDPILRFPKRHLVFGEFLWHWLDHPLLALAFMPLYLSSVLRDDSLLSALHQRLESESKMEMASSEN